jgi:mono/diheme cytochrome c family protein
MRRTALIAAATLICLAGTARAEEFGDVHAGQIYVKDVCASCHAVQPEASMSPKIDAPSFAAVANTPGMTRTALTVWLTTPHPTMPNFVLEAQDLDNVIAYILSLKND